MWTRKHPEEKEGIEFADIEWEDSNFEDEISNNYQWVAGSQ